MKKKKKKSYHHLNQLQRDRIQALLKADHKQKEIALVLNIDKSTISREICRNRRGKRTKKGAISGSYEANVAQHKSYVRRKYAKYQGKKIWENKELRKYIEKGLKKHWSPNEISGRMKYEKQPFYASKTSIYRFLYSSHGQYLCCYLPSKRYGKRKRKEKKSKRALIPNRIGINKRPKEADLKLKYGHFEGDTIVSGKKTGSKKALSVIYERKAKYVDAQKISSLKPEENNKAILEMAEEIKIFRTFTLDNGIENAKHENLQKELGIQTFFCDPYSSWQKGGIENVNSLIRRFIPKGCDINDYPDAYIQEICDILNNKPRQSLGYKTPLEVMIENDVLKTKVLKQKQPPVGGWRKHTSIINLIKNTLSGVALGG